MFPFDEECNKKILRHKNMRKEKNFQTIECYTGLKNLNLPQDSTVLLDCLSNLAANERYQEDGAKESLVQEIADGIIKIKSTTSNLVVVTNEIFSDGIEYDKDTMQYLEYLGKLNCILGKIADEVIEVYFSIPIYHKQA
jgi:adenosylcobinamide kinase/adenosylcobinamide-phosphate guanylyltransferase